jgi:N-[(2S)-2-amino-2-carboxyethyl]-L-glutamate dehydrogenase
MLKVIFADAVDNLIGKDPKLVKEWVRESFHKHYKGEFIQPQKTYLNVSSNPYDRAIALPASLTGNDAATGIKWIGSHSDNVKKGFERASAVIILNNTETMAPDTVVEGSTISTMRTFAVTLLSFDKFLKDGANVGLIGMGKLGRLHAQFLGKLYPSINSIHCYSETADSKDCEQYPKVKKVDTLQELLDKSDVIVTNSRAQQPYIASKDLRRDTSLIVNISLMDFSLDVMTGSNHLIVDDWHQNTQAKKVFRTGVDSGVITRDKVEEFGEALFGATQHKGRIFVNPLGMGLEDIYVASKIKQRLLGTTP